ncbi:hypothetical protein [Marinicella sp. W31]|uniref:hypothetical protein n=1 Tax=Marinicella sp. W31 TaxID=3023713 RepID=UPI0037583AFF
MQKLIIIPVFLLTALGCTYNEQISEDYVFGARYQTMMLCLTSLEARFGKSNLNTDVFTPYEVSGTLPGNNTFSCVKDRGELEGIYYQESYTLRGLASNGYVTNDKATTSI